MSGSTQGAERWERYSAAAEGLPEYWHPATPSSKLGKKPRAWRMLGRDLVFIRHGGRAYALEDRCPHRQIPLSAGEMRVSRHHHLHLSRLDLRPPRTEDSSPH